MSPVEGGQEGETSTIVKGSRDHMSPVEGGQEGEAGTGKQVCNS